MIARGDSVVITVYLAQWIFDYVTGILHEADNVGTSRVCISASALRG